VPIDFGEKEGEKQKGGYEYRAEHKALSTHKKNRQVDREKTYTHGTDS